MLLSALSRVARAGSRTSHAVATAACAASAAALAASAIAPQSACRSAYDGAYEDVTFTERPEEQWIENKQKRLADSFVDWSSVDHAYVDALRAIRGAYDFSLPSMLALREHFLSETAKGLAGEPSSMRMLPAYVTKRVTGQERGAFYALDLGGTNFRVLQLSLEGNGVVGPIKQAKFKVSDTIKKGSGEGLFGFLADSVATFLAKECGGNPSGVMGFTFSFPTEQDALNRGRLIVWNKEFEASGVVGQDVVAMLQKQLVARGISLEVRALANDTVGTMEAAAYMRPDTVMGVILGTGTNAAYIEKTANIGKWRGAPSEEMVINTEWGNLDMAASMNKFDFEIDCATSNPGLQRFEKMISGMYLGEMCRVTVLSPEVLPAFSAGFAAAFTGKYKERMSLPTAMMSEIESDNTSDLSATAKLLEAQGMPTCANAHALRRPRKRPRANAHTQTHTHATP